MSIVHKAIYPATKLLERSLRQFKNVIYISSHHELLTPEQMKEELVFFTQLIIGGTDIPCRATRDFLGAQP
ncbi:MAG: hypothetical protein V7L22_24440 [Nostoc sp.]|uniref:hypothetical protein n=1 Tax=Nostoc sp. TaxID=1180 RepID=UPI002FF88947